MNISANNILATSFFSLFFSKFLSFSLSFLSPFSLLFSLFLSFLSLFLSFSLSLFPFFLSFSLFSFCFYSLFLFLFISFSIFSLFSLFLLFFSFVLLLERTSWASQVIFTVYREFAGSVSFLFSVDKSMPAQKRTPMPNAVVVLVTNMSHSCLCIWAYM